MTFAIGHVEGGTGAGRKRPMRAKPTNAWWCRPYCERGGMDTPNPPYLVRCPDCGTRRDG